jgi:hypothetical protein
MTDFHDRSNDHTPASQGEEHHGGGAACDAPPGTHRLVTITINGKDFEVSPGRHRVAELKRIAGIPDCDELAQVIHGKLHPLKDDAVVEIRGHEKFLASAPSCPSS